MSRRSAGLIAFLAVVPALAGCLGSVLPQAPGGAVEPTGYRLVNGTVWTADDARPWAEAVAVRGERIVEVGSEASVRSADVGELPVEVDLHGGMVLPGFHDTHNHVVRTARDTDPSEGNPYEPWPPGWDPVRGRIENQAVAAGHVARWGHAHADRARDDVVRPEGRLAANDLGFDLSGDAPGERAWKTMLRRGLSTTARFGLTSHVEAGVGVQAYDVLEDLDREGDLTARFNLYVFPEDLDAAMERGWRTGSGDDDVRFLGLKLYTDGWLGPRTAALREMYDDRPHRGFAFFTQEETDRWVLTAHRNGVKVTAHTIGDRSTEMMLSSYERALAEGCPEDVSLRVCEDPRFTLEHTQLVPPDLMDRMVDVGLVPSIQLSFATSDAPWAEDALGEERIEDAYPWRTMWRRNLTVAGSSDFPIEVLPPLWGIQRVVTRVDLHGEPDGGFHPEEALTLEQALKSVTINAAYLEYREDELGSITPGKYADLVVLEEDLFEVPSDEIAETDVWMTMVGGRVVWTSLTFADVTGLEPGQASWVRARSWT